MSLRQALRLNTGFSLQMHVFHDNKIVKFITKCMTLEDRLEVYLQHKKLIREIYPEYMIVEKHT